LGILRLSAQYPKAQMENASQMAREAKLLNYRGVKTVLKSLPALSNPDLPPLPSHENIRGNTYYQ
jgi:hypothetical protein